MRRFIIILAGATMLSGCLNLAENGRDAIPTTGSLAFYPKKTQTQLELEGLPPPDRPVAVTVYNFSDETGQFKPSDQGQTLSRAVSQGSTSMLIKALEEAGNRRWFTVVERAQLKNLLTERQIITEMRQRYLGEKGINPEALPAMLFAGVILEGGVIGYDTNTVTGGAGASFLGIGAHGEYRQDTVTVSLRAVSVRTGEVLATITASKTIASKAIDASVFKYVAFKQLLEAEAGVTTNEPDQIALQEAIEKAVYGLVMEGVDLKLWNFQNPDAGWPMLWRYRQESSGELTAAQVQEAMERARKAPPVKLKPVDAGSRNGKNEDGSSGQEKG